MNKISKLLLECCILFLGLLHLLFTLCLELG